ncbi:uncharacterized protein L201_007077 [Kwoniella dendrophila CBS 6074]|uniref:Erythromycin biosynthesis protein CIII-like C-terminal domain-containing protein n=1 Tax=Kwoniella dendrophila CBS 6074 TaxID=1295534 RepID=A0AAX4K4L4_9TREE
MSKPKVLFLTSPEAGQANVQLSVISKIQKLYGEDTLDIYLGSFEQLRNRCPKTVTFKSIQGKGMIQHFLEKYDDSSKLNSGENPQFYKHLTTPTGLYGSIKLALNFTSIFHSEKPEEYVQYAKNVESLLIELEPDFIICDTIFECGRDAILKLGLNKKCIYLSPNTFKDLAPAQQGLGVFNWPSSGSGYPYPLPWYLKPFNIFAIIFSMIWLLKYDKRHIEFNKYRNQAGFSGRLPLFQKKDELGSTFLCVSNEKVEYPGKIPEWLICCGPILSSPTKDNDKNIEEIDLDLYKWLIKQPTILIVLGTHYLISKDQANILYKSLENLLKKRSDLQVLWKLKKFGQFNLPSEELSEAEKNDQIKIVDWLKPDPLAILNSGQIVAFVNHGGSNSYHEGLATGIPQILLPAWIDCYDFAGRVGYFGNGVWGNKSAAPEISEKEFTKSLFQVVGETPKDPNVLKIKARCRELADIVTENGTREGSTVAAERIWQELQASLAKNK